MAAHQITNSARKELIEKLGSCKRTIEYTDRRAEDLLEVLIRCIESDDEGKLDRFMKAIYPKVREALKPED